MFFSLESQWQQLQISLNYLRYSKIDKGEQFVAGPHSYEHETAVNTAASDKQPRKHFSQLKGPQLQVTSRQTGLEMQQGREIRLTKREELSFLTVLAFPKASSSGLALMI